MPQEDADKLLVLCRLAPALLNRVDYLSTSTFEDMKASQLCDSDLKSHAKKLEKKFPNFDLNEGATEGKTERKFRTYAEGFTEQLFGPYQTIVDLVKFVDEALKLLRSIAGTQMLEHDYYSVRHAVDPYLELVSYLFKIQFLFLNHKGDEKNNIPSPLRLVAVYCKAYMLKNENRTEPYAERIRVFLMRFKDEKKLLTAIQADIKPLQGVNISGDIGNALTSIGTVVMRWQDEKTISTKRNFYSFNQEANLGALDLNPEYHQLSHLIKMKEWLIIGYLVAPDQLSTQPALNVHMLCRALQDHYVIQLHRAAKLNYWGFWKDLFGSFHCTGFKLKQYKDKDFKTAWNNYQNIINEHVKRRMFIRAKTTPYIHFFQQFPDAIAPKMEIIMSLIRQCRDEVLWYYRHHDSKIENPRDICRGLMSMQHSYELPEDEHITYLISDLFALRKCVEENVERISVYYKQYISTLVNDAVAKLSQFVQNFNNRNLSTLLSQLADDLPTAVQTGRFESVRLTWVRATLVLFERGAGIPKNECIDLLRAINPLTNASRYVDGLLNRENPVYGEGMLTAQGHLGDLFYDEDNFESAYQIAVSNCDTVPHVVPIINILDDVLYTITPSLCPEEQNIHLGRARQLANYYLSHVVSLFTAATRRVVVRTTRLRDCASTDAVLANKLAKEEKQRKEAKATARSGSSPTEQPAVELHDNQSIPGFESQHNNLRMEVKLKSDTHLLHTIARTFYAAREIAVCGRAYSTTEFLAQTIQAELQHLFRNVCLRAPSGDRPLNRPTRILSIFSVVVGVFTNLNNYIPLDIPAIARTVLLGEFASELHGVVGAPFSRITLMSQSPLPHGATEIVRWYSGLLDNINVVYSPSQRCFVSNGACNVSWEDYTDVNELRALCELIGPYGLRAMEHMVLDRARVCVENIKTGLVQNQSVLQTLVTGFSDRLRWTECLNNFERNSLDEVVLNITKLGCVLHFRELLRGAQEQVARNRVPEMYNLVKLTWRHARDRICSQGVSWVDNKTATGSEKILDFYGSALLPTSLADFGAIARDVGVDTGLGDSSLRLVFSEFNQSPNDHKLWDLLPVICGAALRSDCWNRASYNIATEGHDNNAHCTAFAIANLLVVANTEGAPTDHAKTVAAFQKFVTCAAYSILHMKAMGRQYAQNIPNIMVFLEQAVLASRGRIDMAFLEKIFPFTMIRFNYINLYEQQTRQFTIGADQKE
jgi:NCK-associated protein 1